jgi:hypothetical protein
MFLYQTQGQIISQYVENHARGNRGLVGKDRLTTESKDSI